MKSKLLLTLLLISGSLMAQKLVRPGFQTVDRYKPNVPSLTVKANPITLIGRYVDAGIEYRNQRTGWVLMNHSYFGGENSVRVTDFRGTYSQTNSYVRFEAAHRWYRQGSSAFRGNIERYTGIYFTAGGSSLSTSDGYYLDQNTFEYVFLTPLTQSSRIDMIVGAELGRTRNYFGQSSPVYAETMWKLGYNLGARLPQVLYSIRFNYKVN